MISRAEHATKHATKDTTKVGKLTLDGIPLHAILVGDLAELIAGNGGVLGVVQVVVIHLGAEERLALGLEPPIKSVRTTTA